MGENTVNFVIVADMLERISKQKKHQMKRKTFRTFLDHFYTDREYYSVMRLILPELDRDRGNYGLKESVLAKCLADALGLAKGSKDAERLINWRKGGSDAGKNAGNFGLLAAEILSSRQATMSGELKVKQVNDMLDALVAAKSRDEKSKILSGLINKTNSLEMKWIILIILKELKLGISEKTFFKEFHPDAEDVYNKTCDIKYVCEKLVDPKVRFKRQDIEVGKPVRPQLASRTANVEAAWKKLKGKRVIAECKFDGDRCQVHKDGNAINFFSRSSIDHKEFADAMSSVILQNVVANKCILDGELVVWNRVTNRFMEFGKIQEVAKNATEGRDSEEQLCYVVFDILYVNDASVIHQPLYERQKLLAATIKPVSGRLELLQPDRFNCGQLWSITAQTPDQIEQFFKTTVENKDEGIVIKDLDSKWEPGDRSGKWIKLKPDYVQPESDLDVLIIGGYFGSGRKGGEVAQFLLGLAEAPVNGNPTKFVSFCKVGTGLSDDECATLVSKLQPYIKKNEKNSRPPSCYIVTNNPKERPDVWIYPPDKSVIMQIASDIRCIKSEVFSSPYCLRFPRVHEVRYDKPWYDCLTVQGLMEIVGGQSGAIVDVTKAKAKRTPRKKVVKPLLPDHLQQTDVSNVTKASELLTGLEFYIANDSAEYKTDKLHKLISENGGKFSMNLTGTVTHVLAASTKGLRYTAAAKLRDVFHLSWLVDSVAEKRLLPFRPKYVLYLTNETMEKLKDTVDAFGDHYFVDVDRKDIEQLFRTMQIDKLTVDENLVGHYKKTFGGNRLFEGCTIYLHKPAPLQDESFIVADMTLRRLEIEVQAYGGTVGKTLSSSTTHVVIFWEDGSLPMAGDISLDQQRLGSLCVVSHLWVEAGIEDGTLPTKDDYDLRDIFCEEGIKLEAVAGRRISRKLASTKAEEKPKIASLWKSPPAAILKSSTSPPSEARSHGTALSNLWKVSRDGTSESKSNSQVQDVTTSSAPSTLWKQPTTGTLWKQKADPSVKEEPVVLSSQTNSVSAPRTLWKQQDVTTSSAPTLWKQPTTDSSSQQAPRTLWKQPSGKEEPVALSSQLSQPGTLWKQQTGESVKPADLWKSASQTTAATAPSSDVPAELWKSGSQRTTSVSVPGTLWKQESPVKKQDAGSLLRDEASSAPKALWKQDSVGKQQAKEPASTTLWKETTADSASRLVDVDVPTAKTSSLAVVSGQVNSKDDNSMDDFLMDMFPAYKAALAPKQATAPEANRDSVSVPSSSAMQTKECDAAMPSSIAGADGPAKKKSKISYKSLINDML